MRHYERFPQKSDQLRIGPVEVIDPNRSVNQNQHRDVQGAVRLRRPVFAPEAEPPNAARRRAASRWISASNPK
jgi:hypothetical protein